MAAVSTSGIKKHFGEVVAVDGNHRHPLGPIKPAIDALKQLDIAAADRRKIFAGNAERLLEEKKAS